MKSFSLFLLVTVPISLVGAGCWRSVAKVDEKIETTKAPVIATVALDNGKATIMRGGVAQAAVEGEEILSGDTINVTQGTINLVYPAAGASYLAAGSKAVLMVQGRGQGSVFARIELQAGSIWTRFERLLGSDEKFSVSGNGVVATVRGTAFGMTLVNGEADVQVAESVVDVAAVQADGQPGEKAVSITAGEGLRISAEKLNRLEVEDAQQLVRPLTITEKQTEGFNFAKQPLPGFSAPTRGVKPGEVAPRR